MSTVRTIVPAAIPSELTSWKLTNISNSVNTTRTPIGMSRDGLRVYAGYNSAGVRRLDESTDDGATWTAVATFADPVLGVVELDNGEAIVVTQAASANPGHIYRSTGWATSHTTATWALTLTNSGGWMRAQWAMHRWSHSGPVIITNEYGPQNSNGGNAAQAATRVYLSTDYGMTWNIVLDLAQRYPTSYTMHVHGSAYDPEWDRLWVTFGDSFPEGNNVAQILYSDDRGATWTAVPLPPEWVGVQSFQVTSIAITPKAVVLGPDSVPFGVNVIPRQGYRKMGTLTTSAHWAGGTGTFAIAFQLFQAYTTGAPMLFSIQGMSTVGGTPTVNCPGMVLMSPDDGVSWVELWRDQSIQQVMITQVVGPTATGKVLWYRLDNTTIYTGELIGV